MDILKHYVDLFNGGDEEVYKNQIENKDAYGWMKSEIPLFECPDKDIERTYYFRWWTYRKHIKITDEGYIISEFLPKVSWSGKYNSIIAGTGHHIYEGRWLKNSSRYLKDYIRFFFNNPEHSYDYSIWLAYAVLKLVNTSGDAEFAKEIFPRLCKYYEGWEKIQMLPSGLFWSYDGKDAMEFSISGREPEDIMNSRRGIRPTLNSYMCADAYAISELAKIAGDFEAEKKYSEKHERLKKLINTELFEDGFYRAYHYSDGDDTDSVIKNGRGKSPREEIGYIPWMFNIPPSDGRERAFELLDDERSFKTDYGIATAERSHPRFLYEANHECLWNGYVWPFATSQTLYALMNVIDNYGTEKYRELYCKLLSQFAKSHTRVKNDGTVVPWIDEVRHPLRDEWSSRTILGECGWLERRGGYERGKDYNHSTFCDLVISGIVGVKDDSEELTVKPCIPDSWGYFRLSGLRYRGKTYDITFDRDGTKYSCGKGLTIKER